MRVLVLPFVLFLAPLSPALEIEPGTPIEPACAAFAQAGYKESGLQIIPAFSDYQLKFWSVGEGVLILTHSKTSAKVVSLSFSLSTDGPRSTRQTFDLAVDSFDTGTGKMVVATKPERHRPEPRWFLGTPSGDEKDSERLLLTRLGDRWTRLESLIEKGKSWQIRARIKILKQQGSQISFEDRLGDDLTFTSTISLGKAGHAGFSGQLIRGFADSASSEWQFRPLSPEQVEAIRQHTAPPAE